MRDTRQMTTIRPGWDVYGSDGTHLGSVADVGDTSLLVQKGLIFVHDIYVPISAIDRIAEKDESVWLNVRKDDVETMGWDTPPTQGSWDDWYARTDGSSSATERERIPVHEEELEVRKTARQAGEVEVRKEVVEEQRSIDVPVTREEVHVRRTPVDRDASAAEATFDEDRQTIRVPVMEEDVEVTKRPRVKEEVEIEKVARQDTKRASGTVRKERVDVTGDGTADINED